MGYPKRFGNLFAYRFVLMKHDATRRVFLMDDLPWATRCSAGRGRIAFGVDYTEQDTVEKESKSDAELEDMILQRLLIGGVFVSVRRDPLLGWRPTVITAPKHMRNAQELADTIASDLRKKFTLKE